MECARCSRPLRDCPACNGGLTCAAIGMHTCVTCNHTGLVCDAHGGDHGR